MAIIRKRNQIFSIHKQFEALGKSNCVLLDHVYDKKHGTSKIMEEIFDELGKLEKRPVKVEIWTCTPEDRGGKRTVQ